MPVLITVTRWPTSLDRRRPERSCGYKRARVESEVVRGGQGGSGRDWSAEQVAAEVTRRCRDLQAAGLLIEQWNLDEIGADLERCGLAGSPTKVFRVQSIVLTKEGYTEDPSHGGRGSATDSRTGRRPDVGLNDRTESTGRSLGLRRAAGRVLPGSRAGIVRQGAGAGRSAGREDGCDSARSQSARDFGATDRPRHRPGVRGRGRSAGTLTRRLPTPTFCAG